MRLAIIGAGIGGCSAAFFAHRLMPDSEITIYELSDRIGGRIYGVELEDQRVEIGAAFFKLSNQFLIGTLKELGIHATPIRSPVSIGVWNGTKFIIKTKHPAIAAIQLFLRHPINVIRLLSVLRELNERNRLVYREVTSHPKEWKELFADATLTDWLQRSLRDVLIDRGIDSKFIDNILEPITRVIYNQESSINAFAGLSAINALYGRSYNIDSGNELIPKSLLEASQATVKLGVKIESILREEDGLYEVSGRDFSDKYDSVIIANHDIINLKIDPSTPPECSSKKFQQVYVKIVRGNLDKSYFNLHSEANIPNTIVSTKAVPFTHIIKLEPKRGIPIYSIASTTSINDYLYDVFKNHEVIFQHFWEKAYPVFEPLKKVPKCKLDKLLYYSNCTEFAVSSMETSILSAFNTVKLLKKESEPIYKI